MDCGPTLDVVDGVFEEDFSLENHEPVWGRLFPLRKEFVSQNLVNDEYTFGRGDECDYCFETFGKKNPHFLSLSKTHFRIYREREKGDSETFTVFIQDKSSNGTFVNGEKIGKNKQRVLNSDDEIALALSKNKAFIFNECSGSSNLSLPKAFNEKYIMSKTLGRGACGEVKLAFEKETCKKFAVKIISKKAFSVGPLGRAVRDEVEIMQSLKHPCVIHIEDVIDSPQAIYIVLELAEGGELFDRVVDRGKFTEPIAKLYFYQLLSSVKYLHDQSITHRDLKPENVLLDSDNEEALIKVTDFGLSKFVGENSLMKTLCGTPSYLAPEVLMTAGTDGYDAKVDCWSMGVILFIMLAGYPPFDDERKDQTLKEQICQGRFSFPDKYWKNVSKEAIDLINKLLTVDPKHRISCSNAMEHPWLQDESIILKAHKLMGLSSFESNGNERQGRKRSAPSSGDENIEKPSKRLTVDTLSPTEGQADLTLTASNDSNELSKTSSPHNNSSES